MLEASGGRTFGPFDVIYRAEKEAWELRTAFGSLRALSKRADGADCNGGGGEWSQWRRRSVPGGEVFRNVADPARVLQHTRDADDLTTKSTLGDDDGSTRFRLTLAPASVSLDQCSPPRRARTESVSSCGEEWLFAEAAWVEDASLNAEELEAFARRGYVVKRGAVPRALVDAARRRINLALVAAARSGRRCRTPGAAVRCDGAGRDPAVLSVLRDSGAWTLAQRLVGRDKIDPRGTNKADVVIAAPRDEDSDHDAEDDALGTTAWRVDGLDEGVENPYAIKVGVALNDQTARGASPMVVFPESHVVVDSAPRDYGGLFSLDAPLISDKARPRLAGAAELRLGAGDVVLLHPKLAYREVPVDAADLAYSVYFRLNRDDGPSPVGLRLSEDHQLFSAYDGLNRPPSPSVLENRDSFEELAADVATPTKTRLSLNLEATPKTQKLPGRRECWSTEITSLSLSPEMGY